MLSKHSEIMWYICMSQEHFQASVIQCSYLSTYAEEGKVWTHRYLHSCPHIRQSTCSCRRQTYVTACLWVTYSCGAVIYMCWLITYMQEKVQVQVSTAERNKGGENESLSCLQQVFVFALSSACSYPFLHCTVSFTIASIMKRDSLTCRDLHRVSWATDSSLESNMQ